jgi:hypothetical protein
MPKADPPLAEKKAVEYVYLRRDLDGKSSSVCPTLSMSKTTNQNR